MRPTSLQHQSFSIQGRLQPQVTLTPRKTFGAYEAYLAKQTTKQPTEYPQSFTSQNKKRDFYDRPALLHNENRQARLTPQNTSYYTFEDSSTVKPNENTIVRNPTLIFNYGRQATTNLNRSQLVQPMNLSKIEFDLKNDGAESIYTFARDKKSPKNLIHQQKDVPRKTTSSKYTIKEVSEFSMKASLVINEIMSTEADIRLSDIANIRSEGKLYEILPHLYSVAQSYKLPQIIKKEISDQLQNNGSYVDYGFLDGESVAYFSFGKNLYLWGFPKFEADVIIKQQADTLQQKFQFDQVVTAVALGDTLPGMTLKDTEKILIVATLTDIKIYGFKKNLRDNKIELIDTKFSIPTDQNVVSSIVQFKKNGRVFYGGTSGHVNELNYDDTAQLNILNLLQGDRRKLKKNDHQNESIIAKLIPSFFKYTENKNITDIKIDEVRNILYSVSISVEEETQGEIIIEVFDLGVLSNKFTKITTIRQVDIVKQMLEIKEQQTKYMKSSDFKRLSSEYPIVYVEPVSMSQSSEYHLMVVTQNGYRIYIQFEQEDVLEPQQEEYKHPFVNTDIIVGKRHTKNWQIADIMHFPNQNSFSENYLMQESVTPFYGGKIRSVAQKIQLDGQQIHCNSSDGIITFIQNQRSSDAEGDFNENVITLNQIVKNESSIAYTKQMREANIDHQQVIPLIELFSQIRIPLDTQIIRNVATPGQPKDDVTEYINENVLSIVSQKNIIHNEIAKLIGANKTYKESRGQYGSSLYEVQSLSVFEKQLYVQGSQLTILTEGRVIQLQQIRPIDTLVMLVHTMIDPRMQGQQMEVFEDFIDMYTCRQTCSMLLQIIVDQDAFYSFSKKIEDILINSKRRDPIHNHLLQHTVSKISMVFKGSKRASKPSHTGYPQGEIKDQVIFRKVSQDARVVAWGLLRKYGDTILNLREYFEIGEDALEGMPPNVQDFSIKHFCLYQYLQRVLRPLWNLRLGYNLPQSSDQLFKSTFDSLNIPRKKLVELQDYISEHEPYLYGEVYQPNQKTNEKFFINSELYQTAKPVYMLNSNQKSKLEMMEKNSLKNITQFLTRCIQAFDLLQILTNNFDNKFFAAVQKQLGDTKVVEALCNLSFKDLVTLDNNAMIRSFLEASVQVESQSSEDTQSLMRKKYAYINKVCSTYFSEDENIAFIGVNLLQAAKKEKSLEKREELLKQAITHLASQPLNIDMNEVPLLLVDNGNYTSLADLTLRKIKALDSLAIDQRERFMSQIEFEKAKDQCYSIILSLFAAIDQSISKEISPSLDQSENNQYQDYIDYFLSKLNAIQNDNLKLHLRDKIMKRIEQFNETCLLTTLFDYLISRPKNQLNMDALPNLNDNTIYQLIVNALSAKHIARPKFDSICKILMKKNQVERFYSLTNQACENFFAVVSATDGSPSPLSLRDKINLVYTCSSLMDTQRQQLSGELYTQYQNRLRELAESLNNQEYIISNIDELTSALNNTISNCKDQGRVDVYNSQVQYLKTLKQSVEQKLIPNDQLIRELQKSCHVSESIIRLMLQRDQTVRHDQHAFKLIETEIKQLIEFMNTHFRDTFHDKLTSKVHIVKDYIELLQIYLGKWQQALNYNYKNVKSENLIDILFKQEPFNNTKFELFGYTFKNLMKEISPEDLFKLFMSQNKVYRLQWNDQIVGTEAELYYIIELIGLTRAWLDANKHFFGAGSQPIITQPIGQQTDEQIMQQAIRTFGVKYYHNVLLHVENKVCNDNYSMCLPNHYTNLVGTIHNLVQDFASMLQQHGQQASQSLNQSVMQQPPAFINTSYMAPQMPSQHEISVNQSIQNQSSSVFSQLSEPVKFKIQRRDSDED